MLHIYVLLVTPLGTCYMAQLGTDQHQSRVAIRKSSHYTGAAANLPVEPFNDIVGSDEKCLLLAKKIKELVDDKECKKAYEMGAALVTNEKV